MLLLLFFFGVTVGNTVLAQEKYFRQYTTNDGLASNQLQSVFQDADGFIWFASFGGVSIYDGYHFTNYTAENKGVTDNITTSIFARSKDETWVVTSSATDVFIKRKWVKTIPLNGFDKYASPLSNYLLTKGGRVLASRDKLIYEVKNAIPQPIATFEKGVTKFFETGNCFVVQDSPVDSVFLVDNSFSNILNRQKGRIFRDRYNRCWLFNKQLHLLDTISLQKGVFKFAPLPEAFRKINIVANKITDLLADADGFYWLLLSGTGVMRIDKEGNSRLFNIKANSSGWENQELMEDAEGNIWVPGDDGAIKFFNKYNDYYSVADGLPNEFVTGITEDRRFHSIWVAHAKGFSCLYQNQLFNFPYPTDHFVWVDLKVQGDSLWVMNNGLFLYKIYYDTRPHVKFLRQFKLASEENFVSCMQQGDDGSMFIIEPHGNLYQLTLSGKRKTILAGDLFAFLIDGSELWTGGFEKGLSRWKITRQKDSLHLQLLHRYINLPDSLIRKIVKDSVGNLWVGTLYKGILKFEKQKDNSFVVRNYYSQNGLTNGWVFDILIDSKGKINVATLGGIFEMQQSGDSVYFENLSPKFGTVLNEIYLVIESNDSSFWLASKSGFIHTRKNLYHPSPPPKVFFTGMFRNNQPDSSISSLKSSQPFSYKENNLVFDFTATSFRNEGRVLYSYKLEKNNDSSKWSLPRPIHSVSLLALSPGSYTLKVKAGTMDNVWSETPAQYSFIINAPFWATWWFRILVILLVGAIIAGFYRFRLNQLKKVMVLRTKISRDLHDEIGSTLSGIVIISEMTKHQLGNEMNPEIKTSLDKISTNSEEMLEKMSDIVWTINPQNDSFEKVISRLKTYAKNTTDSLGIHLHFNLAKDMGRFNLDMQKRNNIYLICKEAINNAIKYSECRNLSFALQQEDHHICISIVDDGKGFNALRDFDGNGLKNMRSRAQEIKADLSLNSGQGKGTSINLFLKIT